MERYGESEKRMRSGVKHGFTKKVRHQKGSVSLRGFQGVVFQGELESSQACAIGQTISKVA